MTFKARAAALKAEQNAEYARSSEERLQQSQAAKQLWAQANKRKEPEEILKKLLSWAEQTQPAVTVAPVAKEAVDARQKQARPDKECDDYDHEEDGPRKQQKNRSSQTGENQRNM